MESHNYLHEQTRRYYDDFAQHYDDKRGGRVSHGYHDLVDELELGFLQRYAEGAAVLEVGCGTGLLLDPISRFASTVKGVDLSPGMLERARARGLDVVEASATALPFDDATFDVACSFKVLPHIEAVDLALSEMLRVVKPGGHIVAELYNRHSLRALLKRLAPAGSISGTRRESDVYLRFDSAQEALTYLPAGCTVVDVRGVRVFTPFAAALEIPVVGRWLASAERWACDTPLRLLGGFYIIAAQKQA